MFLAEVVTSSTLVGLTTGQLFAIVGGLLAVAASIVLSAWKVSGKFATLATKDDLASMGATLATKADVSALGDRLDKRIDELSKEVHLHGERIASIEGAIGYSRKAL